jgi:hypothetical protein
MAKDKNEEKQLDDDEDQPNKEIFLEEGQRDPDEAVFAEQAIHHYADDVLDMFREQVDAAMSQVESFLSGQVQKDQLDDGYFLQNLGGAFLEQAMNAFGGADSPIGRALFSDLASAIDQSVRGEQSIPFVQDLNTAMRDAAWYLRDNLDMILSNQWDELRDLAYEGSTDFIAALHDYGLPDIDFDPNSLSQPMMDVTQQYVDALPKEQEQTLDQEQVDAVEEEEEKLQEPEVENLAMEEEEKKEMAM